MEGNEDQSKCKDLAKCMEYLQLMLDDESSKEQEVFVKAHLDKCAACFEQYEVEKEIRDLLKRKLANKPVPANLAAEIQLKIRSFTA
jgi:mycothiol system anti-sigma-R factor